jgi:hypothetical protein
MEVRIRAICRREVSGLRSGDGRASTGDIWRRGICCGGGGEDRMPRRATEPQLEASKHQFFQSHPPDLPKVALLAIHFQLALASVVEVRSHLKHGIAFIIPH